MKNLIKIATIVLLLAGSGYLLFSGFNILFNT